MAPRLIIVGGVKIKVTIIYDNEAFKEGFKADWGFSCLLEAFDRKILFDTGTKGSILLENMRKLNIDPAAIEMVFISHSHGDHTGGLSDFLRINSVPVYIPYSCPKPGTARDVIKVEEPTEISENIFSTGELKNVEQSLVIRTEKGVVVVVGCSHSGVGNILKAASQFGTVRALIGGLHGFSDFDVLEGLELICATHCTRYKLEIESLYPESYVRGGAGKVIEL
jgi:7,8-dihydropterin-6-yl-methyl-4-(beta-D-ribofuranosyl)aminobenzene 5'-phosphate synthase